MIVIIATVADRNRITHSFIYYKVLPKNLVGGQDLN